MPSHVGKSVVYKYPIAVPEVGVETFLELPRGARLLSVQTVGGEPVVYAEVPLEDLGYMVPGEPSRGEWVSTVLFRQKLNIVPTGVVVENSGVYLGTFQVPSVEPEVPTRFLPSLVFHVFALYEKEEARR